MEERGIWGFRYVLYTFFCETSTTLSLPRTPETHDRVYIKTRLAFYNYRAAEELEERRIRRQHYFVLKGQSVGPITEQIHISRGERDIGRDKSHSIKPELNKLIVEWALQVAFVTSRIGRDR
jgi:hypothetical protein